MTAAPTSPTASPAAIAADRPRRAAVLSMALGWTALLAIAVSVILALVPLHNGNVQACGAPGAFLLEGRVDVYPDADGRAQRSDGTVEQLSPDDVKVAFDRPCSKQVADRMVPAASLFVAGSLVGLGCVVAAVIGAWRGAGPIPGDAVPAEAVPGGAVPGDAVPGDAVPSQAVPGDAVPADADAGASAPERREPPS